MARAPSLGLTVAVYAESHLVPSFPRMWSGQSPPVKFLYTQATRYQARRRAIPLIATYPLMDLPITLSNAIDPLPRPSGFSSNRLRPVHHLFPIVLLYIHSSISSQQFVFPRKNEAKIIARFQHGLCSEFFSTRSSPAATGVRCFWSLKTHPPARKRFAS